MKKTILFILIFSLSFIAISPVSLALGTETDLIELTIDGQPVSMTQEEYEKYIEELEEERFRQAVKEEENKSLEELTHAYLLGDFETGKIFYSNNIDEKVAIASTSKILSIYVIMDHIKSGAISMEDIVHIDREVAILGGSSYDLREGEKKTVSELIIAAMVVSGNDATRALAKHLAGSEEEFVKLMKNKLDELGITDYQIINASGLPNYELDMQNMMTTRDLFNLTRSFIKDYPEILSITSIRQIVEEDRDFDEENTNPILGDLDGIDGLKTGYTGLAGRCMVATGKTSGVFDNTKDMRLIGITMGSDSDAKRYVAIKRIMEDGLNHYQNRLVGLGQEPIDYGQAAQFKNRQISLYAKEPSLVSLRDDQDLTYETIKYDLVAPMEAGAKAGELVYYLDGQEVYKTDLIIKEDIIDPTFLGRIAKLYENGFRKLGLMLGYNFNL